MQGGYPSGLYLRIYYTPPFGEACVFVILLILKFKETLILD
jgi:hypothetical protein